MLNLKRQPYRHTTTRRSLRLTDATEATLATLAAPGLHASAIALAVQLLGAVASGDLTQADDVGETLAQACGWDTVQVESGLEFVRYAVRIAMYLREVAMEEVRD